MRVPPHRIQKAIASLLLLSTSTTFAAPGDYAAAGRTQGSQDSHGEAKRLGLKQGSEDGKAQGYKDGYDTCAEEMRQNVRQNAERQGDRDGTLAGSNEGSARGSDDGQSRGSVDGSADGDSRADRQAYADASPRGAADGVAEANQTDSAARGSAAGTISGNAGAKADANANEYQPARNQYKNERYAEAIRSEATIDLRVQAPASRSTPAIEPVRRGFMESNSILSAAIRQGNVDALELAQSAKISLALAGGPGDPPIPNVQPVLASEKAITYCKANTSSAPSPRPSPNPLPSPVPGSLSEFEKCVDEFKPAYEQAFLATFKTDFLASYRPAFDREYGPNKTSGCQQAKRADYRRDYDQAYRRSYDESYRLVFDRVYRNIFDRVYREVFANASAATFDRNYRGHYDTHYANAKAKAYEDRKQELYSNAFNKARANEYAAKYPGYKQEVVTRGRADEADSFARIPVRLIGLSVQESVKDGIQEPGELLSVDLDLRNFSDAPVASADIGIRAVAKSSGVALPGAVAILTKNLQAKSLNHVVGALDIRLDESALGKTVQVEIQISIRGNVVANETIELRARTLATVSLLETPVVRLGYPGAVRIRVTNQSSLVLPENANLALSTNMQGVVFSKTNELVSDLRAGEARDLTFPFNADNYQDGQKVTFVGSLSLASGRRIGILNESREVPALQDYSFRIRNGLFDGDISGLRKSGKTRLKVFVKNISSRQASQTLTLTASIIGPDAKNFSFVKGNQEVFKPIGPGVEESGDKLVVKANKKNSGGTFVVEVREGGKLIGIYKENF